MGGGGGGHPAPPHPFILQNCVVRYTGKFVISGGFVVQGLNCV